MTPKKRQIGRNNIVLIFSDQQHAAAQGTIDPWFETPNLDRFASQNVSFTHAYCTTPQCTPSRGSIFTGRYPHQTGVLGNIGAAGGQDLTQPTFAQELAEAGYRVGYFGKWHLGDHEAAAQGFDRRINGQNDGETVENALAWLAEQTESESEQPFALIVSLNQPHDVYLFKTDEPVEGEAAIAMPQSWHDDDLSTKPPVQRQFLTDDQGKKVHDQPLEVYQRYRHAYRECVRDYDQSLGKVIDALEARSDWPRTGVLVTSDHGDMDAHHRLCFKGPFMYDQMVRVPLHLRVPETMPKAPPRDLDDLVSLVDIRATLLDIAVGSHNFKKREGISLLPAAFGREDREKRDFVVSEYYSKQQWVNPIRMVATHQFKYIRYRKWGAELYDLKNDPHELHNLADNPEFEEQKFDLSTHLNNWMRRTIDDFNQHWPTSRSGEPLPRS